MLFVAMMCMVLFSIMAVACAMLWPTSWWLADAVRVAVGTLAMLAKAIGLWAIIGGGVWYAVVRNDYRAAEAQRKARIVAIAGGIALIAGTAMQLLDAPGEAYMSVLHMLWQANM